MTLYVDQFTYQLVNCNDEVQDKWFVSNYAESTDNDDLVFLHSDLVLRDSTRHANKWTGYFSTREAAEQAIRDFGATVG